MKDYNEMADAVFRRRDEFVAARKKRNAFLLKAGTSVGALLLVAVVGISVWRALPAIPSVKPTQPVTESSQTEDKTSCPVETQDTQTTQKQDITETVKETQAKVENPQAGNTQKPTLSPDPVESKPAVTPDKPQTGTTLPPDPTEATILPGGDTVDPTSPPWNGDQAPETQSPTAGEDSAMTPDATLPFVTEAPDEPTTVPCVEPTEATVPSVEPTLPTEPVTGSLYIECDGKTYEAQVGDMVNLTVELQADELIQSAFVIAKYDYYYGRLEVVNLEDLGFTKKQLREAHAPNLVDTLYSVGYNAGIYGKNKAVRLDFTATENEYAADFTQKKVLMTFSFMVNKPGSTSIELVPQKIVSVNNTQYFEYGNQLVAEGIDLDAYLTVIPAVEIVLPTPPAEEVKPEEIPFTYPEESTEGDLIINCDGRTYSANIGDTVTFVTELKADEMFENIHIVLDYPEEYLSLNIPEKAKGAFPNMYAINANFLGYKDFTTNEITNPAVIMVATDIFGFDFTNRQVLAQLEFEVIKAGEIDLDMHFEDMFKCNDDGIADEAYFDRGVQKSFDDIYIYDYVIVKKSSYVQE